MSQLLRLKNVAEMKFCFLQQNTKNLDMWVHFSVRGSAELQPKLLFIYPDLTETGETKGFCFQADVGDRRFGSVTALAVWLFFYI